MAMPPCTVPELNIKVVNELHTGLNCTIFNELSCTEYNDLITIFK